MIGKLNSQNQTLQELRLMHHYNQDYVLFFSGEQEQKESSQDF